MTFVNVDSQSVQGTLLSLMLLAIAQLFHTIDVLLILQAIAYICTITVTIDTLTGNRIKKWIVSKFTKHDETKSKRSGSHKKV